MHQNIWKLGGFSYPNNSGWKSTKTKDKHAKLFLSASSFILLEVQASLTKSTRKRPCKKLWRTGDTTSTNNSWTSFQRHRTTVMHKVPSLQEATLRRIWQRLAASTTRCIYYCQNDFDCPIYDYLSQWVNKSRLAFVIGRGLLVSRHTRSSRKHKKRQNSAFLYSLSSLVS